jgi:hypothetical protein
MKTEKKNGSRFFWKPRKGYGAFETRIDAGRMGCRLFKAGCEIKV